MKKKCDKCNKIARWEVGIGRIIRNVDGKKFKKTKESILETCSNSGFLSSRENDCSLFFCDKHFIELSGCGNVIEFRLISDKKWKDFSEVDNPHILKSIVEKSYNRFKNPQIKFEFKDLKRIINGE